MATKKSKPPTNRLTEIVTYRRSQGSGVTGALAGGLKERLKEKFDPRQLINQKGLLTALFPGLKTYAAKTTSAEKLSKSSIQSASLDEIKPVLETISYNTKMTAKNTMVLPAMHRDVNVIRQNMVKLVKLKSGDARTKADMFFVNAKEREEKYERELKKARGNQDKLQKQKDEEDKKKSKGILGFLGKIFSTIINGLKSIVSAILDLGKAIFGAFKLLAEVVIDVIGKALSLLLSPFKLLGNIIKDFFIDFFKTSFMRILVTTVIRGAISAVFSLLFSKKGLVRLAGYLMGVFATTFGLEYFAKKFRESGFAETPLSKESSMEDIRESAKRFEENQKTSDKRRSYLPYQFSETEFQELKNSGILSKNATSEAMGMNKPVRAQSRQFDEDMFFINDKDPYMGVVEPKFNNAAYKLYNNGKGLAKIYDVPIPGFKEPLTLLLSDSEAKHFGKQIKLYEVLMERLSEESKQSKPNRNLIDLLISQIEPIKADISEKSLKLFNEQYNKDYKEYNLLQNGLESIKDKLQARTILDSMSDDAIEAMLGTDFIKNLPSSYMPDVEKGLSKLTDQFKFDERKSQGLNLLDESRQTLTKRIEDFTSSNKQRTTESKTNVQVITNNSSNKDTVSSGEEVAPAWNTDYFENLGDTSIIGIK
jgi:hypothetical protein